MSVYKHCHVYLQADVFVLYLFPQEKMIYLEKVGGYFFPKIACFSNIWYFFSWFYRFPYFALMYILSITQVNIDRVNRKVVFNSSYQIGSDPGKEVKEVTVGSSLHETAINRFNPLQWDKIIIIITSSKKYYFSAVESPVRLPLEHCYSFEIVFDTTLFPLDV